MKTQPKTLTAALELGLRTVPQMTSQREVAQLLTIWVYDYISGQFARTVSEVTEEKEQKRLTDLFDRIVGKVP